MLNPRWRVFIQGLARVILIYLLLCGLGLSLVAGLYYWTHRPIQTMPAVDPIARAPYPRLPEPPTPLVWCLVSEVARSARARAANFERLEPGQWWLNVISSEHGGARLVEVESLPWPPPATVQVLVVTAAAIAPMEPRAAQIEAFAQAGGVVILEHPNGRLLALSGASPMYGGTRPVTPPWLSPVQIDVTPMVLEPGTLPFLNGVSAGGEHRRLPVAWSRRVGEGGVVALNVDLASLFVRHIQGKPKADFTFDVPERTGALKGVPVPADLVEGGPAFEGPVLDLLTRTIWTAALDLVPFPGWWPFPGGAPGAYLCTHDEEGFGDKTRFMAEEERRRKAVSTFFILPEPMTRAGVQSLERTGAEVALHWHRGFGGGNTREKTFGPVVLRREALALGEQQRMVAALLGGRPSPMTRIHGLQWDPDFDTTFRKMVAAGIRLDSSYGPYGALSPYRFGSLQPFRPLDRDGRILPIFELPFVLQDDEAAPLETLRKMIDDGARHQLPIVPIFHVNTMQYKPSVGPLEAWIEGFERASGAGLWSGTLGQYLDFLERRERSGFKLEARGLGVWEGEVVAFGSGLSMRVPGQSGGGVLVEAALDGQPLTGLECRARPVQAQALIPVPTGTHRLSLRYARGESLCAEALSASGVTEAIP